MRDMGAADVEQVRKGGYTHFDNGVFAAGLSCRAIGLLVYMLSRPPGWRFSSTRIANDVAEGRDAIRTALRELRDAGFVALVVLGGDQPTQRYFVRDSLEVPWPAQVPAPENPAQESPAQAKSGAVVSTEEVSTEEVSTEEVTGGSGEPQRRRQFPKGWTPGEAERAIADSVGMAAAERREQWDQFHDHHVSTGKVMLDWPAAWRTWCRNWRRFNAQRPGAGPVVRHAPGMAAIQRILAEEAAKNGDIIDTTGCDTAAIERTQT